MHALLIAGIGLVVAALTAVPAATSAATERGVTPTTVQVGGLVIGDARGQGADLGARARFERANGEGRVGGRTITYAGASPITDTAAAARLADEAFAVVPAVGIAQEASTFATERLPFVGVATAPEWFANPWGFGITGASLAPRSKTGNPAWGVQLRALLGGAKGTKVAIVVDSDPLGPIRAAETTAALRKVGFEVAAPLTLPAPPIDAAVTARSLVAGVVPPPPAILLLTSATDALAVAQQLAALGYTGTVGVGEGLYAPSTPAIGAGLTALVPIAPIEADTPALRRMTADVRAIDAAAVITPAVAEGYFAADLFLDALRRVGRKLTAKRFVAVANGGRFSYEVAGTVGRSTWPAMHTHGIPCGGLVQGDGTRYYVAEPYRCDPPIRFKAR
jgi:branched-chain amino acid transport system substrate-binding protein